MHFEKHKIFLNGTYRYNQDSGKGELFS